MAEADAEFYPSSGSPLLTLPEGGHVRPVELYVDVAREIDAAWEAALVMFLSRPSSWSLCVVGAILRSPSADNDAARRGVLRVECVAPSAWLRDRHLHVGDA